MLPVFYPVSEAFCVPVHKTDAATGIFAMSGEVKREGAERGKRREERKEKREKRGGEKGKKLISLTPKTSTLPGAYWLLVLAFER